MPNKMPNTIKIAVILRCQCVLSVVIQSLRLSFSPRLFVIILLRLVSMHSWRLPTRIAGDNKIMKRENLDKEFYKIMLNNS